MLASSELNVLIINIEEMKLNAETRNKWIYIDILKEIRETRDRVRADDLEMFEAFKIFGNKFHKREAN